MADIEKIFKRDNGTEARILVLDFTSPFSKKPEYDCNVFTRKIGEKNWTLISDSQERRDRAKTLSVEEFVKNGRNPIFYIVSIAEMFSVINIFLSQYKKV